MLKKKNIVAEVVENIRRYLGVKTQGEVAEAIGMNGASLSARIKRRSLTKENIVEFCQQKGVSPDMFLTSPDLPQEAETAADAGDGSDQGQNALKHGSGHSGIDKGNRVNVNLAHSKTTQGEAMSGDRLLRYVEYLENENKQLKQKVKEFEDRENQREAANG